MRLILLAFSSIVCLTVLLAACAGVDVDTSGMHDGEELVVAVCNECHTFERVCDKLGADKEKWAGTVRRMDMYGAPLSDAQAATVSQYLADLAPGSRPVCGR